MNYSFQMTGLIKDGKAGVFDYSRFEGKQLNENSLHEPSGLTIDAAHYGTTHYCQATKTASAGL